MGMIALIDNYDSFSYNLVQSLMGQDAEVEVYRVRGDALSKPLSNNALMHGI